MVIHCGDELDTIATDEQRTVRACDEMTMAMLWWMETNEQGRGKNNDLRWIAITQCSHRHGNAMTSLTPLTNFCRASTAAAILSMPCLPVKLDAENNPV